MASHSSILAWKIPWVEEPGGLPSMGHKELDMTELLSTQAQIMFLVDWAFLEQTKLAFHKHIFLSSCLLLWYSPTKISLDCFSDLTSNYTSTKCLCWLTLDKIQSSLALPYLLLVILLTSFNSQSLQFSQIITIKFLVIYELIEERCFLNHSFLWFRLLS